MDKKLFGHESLEASLSRLLSSERLGSALIFSGQSGIGKRSAAYLLSAYILSETSPRTGSLSISDNATKKVYKMILSNTHPDFWFIDNYAVPPSIDNYRLTLAKVYKKPVLGRRKVVIIDGAELLSMNIFNAMLKFVEEPPQDTVIILITTNIDIIPVTLRSRCSKFEFHGLSYEDVNRALEYIGEVVSHDAVILANGSVGDAIRLGRYSVYKTYLECLSSGSVSSLLNEYDVDDFWWAVKKCILRTLSVLVDISLENELELMAHEKNIYCRYTHDVEIIAETSTEILRIMSELEVLKLDKTIFLNWFVAKLNSLIR